MIRNSTYRVEVWASRDAPVSAVAVLKHKQIKWTGKNAQEAHLVNVEPVQSIAQTLDLALDGHRRSIATLKPAKCFLRSKYRSSRQTWLNQIVPSTPLSPFSTATARCEDIFSVVRVLLEGQLKVNLSYSRIYNCVRE